MEKEIEQRKMKRYEANRIIDFLGILSICSLTDEFSFVSIVFFSIGTGLTCAICEVRKITENARLMMAIEALAVVMYASSVLGEMEIYLIFMFSFGICLMFVANNIKKRNKATSVIVLCSAIVCSVFPFILCLNRINIFIFVLAFTALEVLIYRENKV